MHANLAGLSSTTTGEMIVTYDQLGGTGIVRNKALAIPGHLNGPEGGPWASIEYVSIEPTRRGKGSSVGIHTQTTDELYYIVEGTGLLSTNGGCEMVLPGCLALAPRGTTHSMFNPSSDEPLSLLVVELHAGTIPMPPTVLNLLSHLRWTEAGSHVRVGQRQVPYLAAMLDLRAFFGQASRWGTLSLMRLPPGARMEEVLADQADHLLFLSGFISVAVTKSGGLAETLRERNEDVLIETRGEGHHSLLLPCGASYQITNRASGNYPATILCVTVPRLSVAHPPLSAQKEEQHHGANAS